MLQLNQIMAGFTILGLVSQQRAGRQDGAVILGHNAEEGSFIVAEVAQDQVASPEPAATWAHSNYFARREGDTDLDSKAANAASSEFLRRSGLEAFADRV